MLLAWQLMPKRETNRFVLGLLLMSALMLGWNVLAHVSYGSAFVFIVLITSLLLAGSRLGARGVLGVIALAVMMGLGDHPTDYHDGFTGTAFTVGVAMPLLLLSIGRMSQRAVTRQWRGTFLSLFVPAMILTCFANAHLLSSLKAWEEIGPPLLFLGLLTLINAPFDWASLG
jgi:hypothetical protein